MPRRRRQPARRPPNRPLKVFRIGLVSASVWRRRYRRDDGQVVYYPVITLQRRYQDRAGNWQTSHYYGPVQAALAAQCLDAARRWIEARLNPDAE